MTCARECCGGVRRGKRWVWGPMPPTLRGSSPAAIVAEALLVCGAVEPQPRRREPTLRDPAVTVFPSLCVKEEGRRRKATGPQGPGAPSAFGPVGTPFLWCVGLTSPRGRRSSREAPECDWCPALASWVWTRARLRAPGGETSSGPTPALPHGRARPKGPAQGPGKGIWTLGGHTPTPAAGAPQPAGPAGRSKRLRVSG